MGFVPTSPVYLDKRVLSLAPHFSDKPITSDPFPSPFALRYVSASSFPKLSWSAVIRRRRISFRFSGNPSSSLLDIEDRLRQTDAYLYNFILPQINAPISGHVLANLFSRAWLKIPKEGSRGKKKTKKEKNIWSAVSLLLSFTFSHLE